MVKPYLLVVTGRPGSGKTTFARELGRRIHMPVIGRDEIKEGYVHTLGKGHAELPEEANKVATDIFFDVLEGLVASGVSVVAEAAFQHGIWSAKLAPFAGRARIHLLICEVDAELALDRFLRRGLGDASREYFHGDAGVDMARRGIALRTSPYEAPRLGVPTFHVDTSGAYDPSIEALAGKIMGRAEAP